MVSSPISPKIKIPLFLALTAFLSMLSYFPILVSGSLYDMGGLFMLTLIWSLGVAAMLTQFIADYRRICEFLIKHYQPGNADGNWIEPA